jgi:hypothetical protein
VWIKGLSTARLSPDFDRKVEIARIDAGFHSFFVERCGKCG